MTRKISLDAIISKIRMTLQGSSPSSPAAGYLYFFGKTADKRLYMKDEAGLETDISGSINGPASSTDNAIVRFDGTGGKTTQDSVITVGDTGAITFPDNIRQTFNPGADAAGVNVGSHAGDPGTPSNGDLWYDSTANELTARINGANVALGAGGGGSSVLVQKVSTQTGEVATGSTTIPVDDTIPQNTEGDEYMTRTITPTNSSNILYITVTFAFGHSSINRWRTVALFQDSTADALAAATNFFPTGTTVIMISFTHKMIAGTTSSTTFKVRAGADSTGTTTFNGAAGGRYFGGKMASSIVIEEVTP